MGPGQPQHAAERQVSGSVFTSLCDLKVTRITLEDQRGLSSLVEGLSGNPSLLGHLV